MQRRIQSPWEKNRTQAVFLPNPKHKLLDQCREVLRFRHYLPARDAEARAGCPLAAGSVVLDEICADQHPRLRLSSIFKTPLNDKLPPLRPGQHFSCIPSPGHKSHDSNVSIFSLPPEIQFVHSLIDHEHATLFLAASPRRQVQAGAATKHPSRQGAWIATITKGQD